MPPHPDLAAALAAVETAARALDVAEVPALLGELERVKALAWARLAAPVPPATPKAWAGDAVVDDVHEVARLVRRSVSWVRKRGHTLPGFHQPGGKGTRVTWGRRALEAWATGGLASHTGIGIYGPHAETAQARERCGADHD